MSDPTEELKQYVGHPKCQDCGWKLGTDITNHCSCNSANRDDEKHQRAFNRARELQELVKYESLESAIGAPEGSFAEYLAESVRVEGSGRTQEERVELERGFNRRIYSEVETLKREQQPRIDRDSGRKPKKEGYIKRLAQCLMKLGLRHGFRYWRLQNQAMRNPEMVSRWSAEWMKEADFCESVGEYVTAGYLRAFARDAMKLNAEYYSIEP